MRNLRGKVPDASWPDVAIRARACYEAASPALATVLRDDFVQVYERDLPAAARCFLDDFDACTAHLRFPLRHRKVIRTTDESVKGCRSQALGGTLLAGARVTPSEERGERLKAPPRRSRVMRINVAPLWWRPCPVSAAGVASG